MKTNACETCGACCAFWCVSFPREELDTHPGGWVPAGCTRPLNDARNLMKGTQDRNPRCLALQGSVGFRVQCRIYENRPSTCRDFKRSWEDDTGNFLCDKARAAYGLQPFSRY